MNFNLLITNSGKKNMTRYVTTNLKQLSTKVLKFGTLFLFQSLVCQIFLALERNCESFYRTFAALIPFLTIVLLVRWPSPISPVATWVSSLSINYNAVKNVALLKRKINKWWWIDDNDNIRLSVCRGYV